MATIVSTRILALQATSPRIVAVPLPTNVTVDLSNTSQALNNLPSYTRVSGVTALATQSTLANGGGYLTGFGSVSSQNSLAFGGAYLTGFGAVASQASLAYGGSYLTGFGVLASQATVNLASQITGSLANANVSGLGALALLGSVALDGAYVVNNLAATRIGAGTIAAGVIYAGDIAASQITSGYIAVARLNAGTVTVDKLANNSITTLATGISFGLGTTWDPAGVGNPTAVVGRSTDAAKFAGAFTQTAANGYALVAAQQPGGAGTGAAIAAWGNWDATSNAYSTSAYLGARTAAAVFGYTDYGASFGNTSGEAGILQYWHPSDATQRYVASLGKYGWAAKFTRGTAEVVEFCDNGYAVNCTAGSTRVQAFGANNATPQTAYTVNAASTDLATVVALCNQIRTALVNNGICV